MNSIVVLVSLILCAPNPGFEARIHSPQGRATPLKHFDQWSDQALIVCRNLLDGSDVGSNGKFDNPNLQRYTFQRNYRQSVSGEHLVITFYGAPANNIVNTKSADLSLLEIVIGLKRTENARSYSLDKIYSVDDEGRIRQHVQSDDGKRNVFNEFIGRIVEANEAVNPSGG